MPGILSWGTYVPVWKLDKKAAGALKHTGGKGRIAVPGKDEDAFTIGLQAAEDAVKRTDVMPTAVFFASADLPAPEQNPAALAAYTLGLAGDCRTANFSGSALAGAEAVMAALDYVSQNSGSSVLVIISEAMRVAATNSRLELLPGAGAAAFVIGAEPGAASFGGTKTSVDVFPDLWMNDGYLQEADNNFRRQAGCAKALGSVYAALDGEFDYIAYSQPEENTVKLLTKQLKVVPEVMQAGEFVSKVGDTAAAAPFLSLVKVLESAEAGKRIAVLAYGAGSAIAICLRTEDGVKAMQSKSGGSLSKQMDGGKEINYVDFLSLRNLLTVE